MTNPALSGFASTQASIDAVLGVQPSDLVSGSAADKILKLPEAEVGQGSLKRRLFQPIFKLPLESLHDARMRIEGTMVFLGSRPYYCRRVAQLEPGDFVLLLDDEDNKQYRVNYSNRDLDLRNPEAQYLQYEQGPAFLTRRPVRQQRQGLSYDNTLYKRVGNTRLFRPDNIHEVVRSLRLSETVRWEPTYLDLMTKVRAMTALRLSPAIAVYVKDKKLLAEYKGRPLGKLEDNSVTVDELDYEKPWIKRDINLVGCEMRKK